MGALVLAGCAEATPTPTATSAPTDTAVPTVAPTNTPTAAPTATLTPEPLAARVNGTAIPLADYDREVKRCEVGYTATQRDPAACRAAALQELIARQVVVQAASQAGRTVAAQEVAALPTASAEWLAANAYTAEEFRAAQEYEILRAQLAEAALAFIGPTADQVHARAIVVGDVNTAITLHTQIKGGADFVNLAVAYSLDLSSRPAGGDLGWFPQGMLTAPEVEQAAFALQPNEVSDVITGTLGFYIVQTLERDPARPLSPQARQTLRDRAYQVWLDGLLQQAKIETFITP